MVEEVALAALGLVGHAFLVDLLIFRSERRLLRRPEGMDRATWLNRWQLNHTSVAIETQSTFGYTQNWVVRTLTPEAPGIDGIVEELFPAEAITDLKAFFGAADDKDLQNRIGQMVTSTTAFGANENIDTVPTSRYVFKTPFGM